jgi:hypothetical protein
MYEWYERKRKSVVRVWVSAGEGERERERDASWWAQQKYDQ